MKGIKKYTDVIRYGKESTRDVLKKGDFITITEKIDGANASFRLDKENPLGVSCYSRNQLLCDNKGLRGFGDWVINNIVPKKLLLNENENLIFFGEWLVSHSVQYKPECYNKFYLFSIFNEEKNEYLSDEYMRFWANALGIKTVECFYEGEFVSFEHLMSFVGKSNMSLTKDTGEGVVVKNIDYKDNYGNQCFVKLVSERFAETKGIKIPKNPVVEDEVLVKLRSVMTDARIEKIMNKLVDEEILNENYTLEDMNLILKHMGNRVIEDIIKEELETIENIENKVLGKYIGKIVPPMVRNIINNK
jgi:ATP-dependent RNA circularization protein (DNA/RNA ligase family)